MRIRPAVEVGPNRQDAFAVITPAQVVVIGCPLSTVPKPVVTIAPKLDVKNVVSYDWSAQLTSDAANPLVVQYNQPKAVVVRAALRRSEGTRSASVQGSVQLQAQGRTPLSVYKVQVGLICPGSCYLMHAMQSRCAWSVSLMAGTGFAGQMRQLVNTKVLVDLSMCSVHTVRCFVGSISPMQGSRYCCADLAISLISCLPSCCWYFCAGCWYG